MMPAPDPPADASGPDERLPEDLAEAGIYPTMKEGFDHSLVVLALGQDCWLIPSAAGCRLLVEPAVAGRVRAELLCYDCESVGWPPPVAVAAPPMAHLVLMTPLLWSLVVLAVFCGQLRHPEWTGAGTLDAAAVFGRGEGWRALTALFLHTDVSHLMSNLLGGVFIFAAVLSIFGLARGWLLLGLAAVAGNLTVAAAHYPAPYRSIGASTAIFAGLGLLTGRAVGIAICVGHPHRWRSFFVPFATGLIILALYGAGGPPVDVLAHVAGFVAGAVLGFIAGRPAAAASSSA
jgi:membrane associated rhomboid family serine protease